MFARAYGATTMGVEGIIINVEIDCSPGLPCFDMVGLPDAAVKEAKERVRTGIKNSGIKLNAEKREKHRNVSLFGFIMKEIIKSINAGNK